MTPQAPSNSTATGPAERPLRFAIIGAGVSGLLSAIKLREAGFDDFTIYEKADRPGGTWRENTYPGIACDVPSHMYRFSFEPNPEWTHRYSPGAEIQTYLEGVAKKYGLEERICYGRELARCEFGEGRWHLEMHDGSTDHVDVVVAATGVLHHPNVPEFEGTESFEGALFHSARWDHDIPLDGRRIGVVGTGSSGVQIVAALASRVAKLCLFQRTAQWIMPQDNPAYGEEEKARFREHPELMDQIYRETSQLFEDNFANAVAEVGSPQIQILTELTLANLENSVKDPELRERLRPDYQAACKRLVISPDFYEAIQHPNAELVTDAIDRIEPTGVRTADGRLHELDVIALATGFRVDRFLRPVEVVGRNGVRLDDRWAERPTAYLSISIPDFPNLFLLNGPNGPVGNFSLIDVAEQQLAYIEKLIGRLRSGACREICATREATEAFEAERTEAAKKTIWMTGCRSWYLDDRGIPAVWPWKLTRFREEMAAPKLQHYEER